MLASTALLSAPEDIACSSAGNCLAVGQTFTGSVTSISETAFYASEVSGSWSTQMTLPILAPAASSVITNLAVACAPGGPCTVLGSEGHNTCCKYFTEVWTPGQGFTAGPTELHFSGSLTSVDLGSISCPSSTTCVAVGSGSLDGRAIGAAAISNDGVWGPVTPLNDPTRGPNYGLNSISCASPGNCVAIGHFQFPWNSILSPIWADDLTAGKWGAPQTLLIPIGVANTLSDEAPLSLSGNSSAQVSCVDMPMTCSIVNTYLNFESSTPYAVVAQSGNGIWGQFTMLPLHVATGRSWILTSLSCVAGPFCAAAGASENFHHKANRVVDRSFQWFATGGPPGPPTSPSAKLVARTEARVTWSHPVSGAPVDHYNVWASTGPVQRTYPLETKSTTVLLRGLTLPHTTYAIEIQAIGRDGQAMAPVAPASVTTS